MKKLKIFALLCATMCLCLGFVACGKNENPITSVSANNLTTIYTATDTVNFDGLTLTVTYKDKSTKTLTKFEIDPEVDENGKMKLEDSTTEFAIFTSGLSSQTAGELTEGAYNITARIAGNGESTTITGEGGVTITIHIASSDAVYTLGTINVYAQITPTNFNLVSFDYSDSIQQYYATINTEITGSDESQFTQITKNVDDTYVAYEIGDDNPFVFKPTISLMQKNSTEVIELPIKITYTIKDLNGVEVGSNICTIDADSYSLQFSEQAAGNAYVITMTPTDFETDMFGDNVEELKLMVLVFDGYNAYNAMDLGRMNLLSASDAATRATLNGTEGYAGFLSNTIFYDSEQKTLTTKYFYEIWNNYFIEQGVFADASEITTIHGIFIHNDITITEADLPSEYIITASENSYAAGTIRDWAYLYTRFLVQNETFNLSGNYFTLDLKDVKPARTNTGVKGFYYNQVTAGDGHIEVFMFGAADYIQDSDDTTPAPYDCTANVRNLAANGNSGINFSPTGGSLSDETTERTGSLCFLKSDYCATTNVDNVIVTQFFTGFQASMDSQGDNTTSDNDAGNVVLTNDKIFDCYSSGLYSWVSINNSIENCTFKRFGGPVIVSCSRADENDSNTGSVSANKARASSWTIDENSVLESYVSCTEAWFVLHEATTFATYLSSLNNTISNYQKTIYQTKDGTNKFNLILVALDIDYLGASLPNIHSSLKSSTENGTYNYDSDYLKYVSSQAQNAAIIQTNGGTLIATDFNTSFVDINTKTAPTSINGTKMYLHMPVPSSNAVVGIVIDLYSTAA